MECGTICLSWPPPSRNCIPCLPAGTTIDQLCETLSDANETAHDYSARKFSGCECWTQIQICPMSCTCEQICSCDPCFVEMVNVSDCVNGPVWEILEVAVNGAPLTDLTGWRILENRYLSCPPTGWPQQSLSQQGCYWTVTLRHGATPPRGLLRLRDELFAEYLSNCGPAAASCNTDGITSISTKSGSYQFTETGSALDKICARYGVNSFSFAGFHDPGDPTKQYRILKLATGSTEQGQSDCEEWARGWATANPQTPAQAPTITNQKVYNKLGQPIG